MSNEAEQQEARDLDYVKEQELRMQEDQTNNHLEEQNNDDIDMDYEY